MSSLSRSTTAGAASFDRESAPTEPTEKLWHRLARPFDSGEIGQVLLGIPAEAVHELADAAVCAGDEATALLDTMPRLIRRLRVGNSQRHERCVAGIKGPVLWAETAAARSSSLGNDGVFVCSIPGRDYDVAENRVLVSALKTIVGAGRRAHARWDPDHLIDPPSARMRANTDLAARYLTHRALAQVQPGARTHRRSLSAIVSGRNATIYRPAVDVLERAAEPLELTDLLSLCRPSCYSHHELLMAAVEAMEVEGRYLPGLRAESGSLIVGPYEYLHPGESRTGTPQIGILRNDKFLIALDPLRAGIDRLHHDLVGARVLDAVTTSKEMAEAIARQMG